MDRHHYTTSTIGHSLLSEPSYCCIGYRTFLRKPHSLIPKDYHTKHTRGLPQSSLHHKYTLHSRGRSLLDIQNTLLGWNKLRIRSGRRNMSNTCHLSPGWFHWDRYKIHFEPQMCPHKASIRFHHRARTSRCGQHT